MVVNDGAGNQALSGARYSIAIGLAPTGTTVKDRQPMVILASQSPAAWSSVVPPVEAG
jgi:hypothetical protein